MKFKTRDYDDLRGFTVKCAHSPDDTITVETRADGKKGLFIVATGGVILSRAKALKLAWAIIDELNPSIL